MIDPSPLTTKIKKHFDRDDGLLWLTRHNEDYNDVLIDLSQFENGHLFCGDELLETWKMGLKRMTLRLGSPYCTSSSRTESCRISGYCPMMISLT